MPKTDKQTTPDGICPTCGNPLSKVTITKKGRKLQRCSTGSWDPQTKKNIGCDYIKWFAIEPQKLDEKCPKCGSQLVFAVTRFGKKMKKCSTGGWDAKTKKATGCDYIQWLNGTTESLDEDCPDCGNKLILFTTNAGKKMKKCSTAGWDKNTKKPTGCEYIYWLRPNEYPQKPDNQGEEFLPPEPRE